MWGRIVILFLCVFCIHMWCMGESESAEDEAGPWYFFTGNSNNHPPLDRADRRIDQQLNKPLQLIAPSLEDVRSFSDEAEDFRVWTPYLGIGRLLSNHWDLFWQMGYAKGGVRTHQSEPSLLILPLHEDVTIYRGCFFTSLGLAYFPWEVPELRLYDSLGDRLKNAKPFVMTTMNYNILTAEAKIKIGLEPFVNLIHMTQKDEWNPWSTGVGVGVEVPLSKSSALSFNVQYSFYWDEGEDFSAPGFNMHWKKMF